MDKDRELDELISKYTDDLIKLKEKWSKWGITTQEKKPASQTPATKPEEVPDSGKDAVQNEALVEETLEIQNENTEKDTAPNDTAITPSDSSNIAPSDDIPISDPENYAMFSAKAFTGNQAYPVANAKVSVYLDGKLHIFLITDENGETKKVKLQSYPALNAFIPENTQQILDYSADIYADGFTPRKGLLVSAVGGSDILLNVEMTPVSERID